MALIEDRDGSVTRACELPKKRRYQRYLKQRIFERWFFLSMSKGNTDVAFVS